MVEALNSALSNVMLQDKNIVILGEDVARDGGVFRVTDNLFKKYPNRVFDTPLAESAILGTSIGLAINGLKPVAEIQNKNSDWCRNWQTFSVYHAADFWYLGLP